MTVGSLQEMMNDYKSGIYNYTKDGKCSGCGNCCSRHLAMSNKEINTIRNYIKKHNIVQQKHAVYVYADPMFDATSPFLDDSKPNHKCTIYEVRPLICREFKCDCWQNIDRSSKLYRSDLHPVDAVETFFPEIPKEYREIVDGVKETKKWMG